MRKFEKCFNDAVAAEDMRIDVLEKRLTVLEGDQRLLKKNAFELENKLERIEEAHDVRSSSDFSYLNSRFSELCRDHEKRLNDMEYTINDVDLVDLLDNATFRAAYDKLAKSLSCAYMSGIFHAKPELNKFIELTLNTIKRLEKKND
jgi:hypothetical protein